jgi:hypothetical protein
MRGIMTSSVRSLDTVSEEFMFSDDKWDGSVDNSRSGGCERLPEANSCES